MCNLRVIRTQTDFAGGARLEEDCGSEVQRIIGAQRSGPAAGCEHVIAVGCGSRFFGLEGGIGVIGVSVCLLFVASCERGELHLVELFTTSSSDKSSQEVDAERIGLGSSGMLDNVNSSTEGDDVDLQATPPTPRAWLCHRLGNH